MAWRQRFEVLVFLVPILVDVVRVRPRTDTVLLSFVHLRGIESLVQTLVIPFDLWFCVTSC